MEQQHENQNNKKKIHLHFSRTRQQTLKYVYL